MRATKLSLRADLRRKTRSIGRTKMTFAGQTDLRKFTHQLANQLTVINLSCSKLRHNAVNVLPPACLEDIEGVERAVEEITGFVRMLQPEENRS